MGAELSIYLDKNVMPAIDLVRRNKDMMPVADTIDGKPRNVVGRYLVISRRDLNDGDGGAAGGSDANDGMLDEICNHFTKQVMVATERYDAFGSVFVDEAFE